MTTDPLSIVLRDTTATLETCGIPYAITGSVASSILGEPYASEDVDIIVSMTAVQARQFARALPSNYYRSEEGLAEIAEKAGMINIIEMSLGFKVDISCPNASDFHAGLFRRRVHCRMGIESDSPSYYFVSPEDIILMKLVWRKDTRSHKQWNNALGVVRVRGALLDWKYLFEQSRVLGIENDLKALRDEGGV